MRHLDPDVLALLALGEQVADERDATHLAECRECAGELANLTHAVDVGRASLDSGELLEPNPRVWARVVDELGIAQEAAVPLATIQRRRARRETRPRWVLPTAIAASLILVAGGGLAIALVAPKPTVLASATLNPFPGWPGASGNAVVEAGGDGSRLVHITLQESDKASGYREAWLMTPDLKNLVSLGVVRDGRGTFTVPDGIDIASYDIVDVSDEPYDGNPTHSGDSIVRGQLN